MLSSHSILDFRPGPAHATPTLYKDLATPFHSHEKIFSEYYIKKFINKNLILV